MLKTIIKRDGTEVPFNSDKILNAIAKASAVVQDGMSTKDLIFLTEKVCEVIEINKLKTVEEIQDAVEDILIKYNYNKTAKEYILYRSERSKIRNSESYLMDIFHKLTYAPAIEADIKRENANIDADTAMGTMLKYGSESSKYFIDNYVLPKDISAAHTNGDIHIHDKDFYMLTETCCQIDLLKLFKNGFSTGHGFLREPNSIESYSCLACIAIQANQNEMHGGQSIPNFDYGLAPGVKKTYRKEYKKSFISYLQIKDNISEYEAEQEYNKIFKVISPELIILHDRDVPKNLKYWIFSTFSSERYLEAHDFASIDAAKKTNQRCYQAMEALVHNLNTMNSRAGAQVPFSSLNYGTDTSPEGRMIIKNLLLATKAGLGNGETPIFPVQIFKVKDGVNYNQGDPNYDLFKLALEVSSIRLFPNFSFIDATFNKQYYKPNDYNSEIAYMGCRTRVLGNTYDPNQQVTCGRGNLSFTSINLPRIGIEANHDIKKYYELLDSRMDLVFRQLIHRFKIQSAKKVYNYPFLMGNQIWLESENLNYDDSIGEILKHGTLTVGFIGLAESLKALTGFHHGENEKSRKLGYEIIQHMRDKCDAKSKELKLNFSLIATPAEGLSGRFVKIDKQKYGEIPGVTDREYYTNSFHVPVYYPIKIFEKIDIEAPFHEMTNGGHITYVELDGDTSKNLVAFEQIIRYMHDKNIGYGSINHPVDRDPLCGYIGIIGETCPRCGRRDGEALTLEQLSDLRKKYTNVPIY